MEHGLDTQLIAVVAGSTVAWGLVSARFERLNLSAPIVFVALGLVFANEPLSVVDVNVHSEGLRSLAEITLALLLFSDAARVNLQGLRRDAGITTRLLVIGLPLTIAFGTVLAVVLFPDLDPWAAAVIAAAVAPTDAALGAQVVEDRRVPQRIRRVLNVESGLNDGIATPFVTFFLAGAASDLVAGSSPSPAGALVDLAVGVITGVGVGLAGGLLITLAQRHDWAAPGYRAITVLALALFAYATAVELDGNGFIAAFSGGLAFGALAPARKHEAALEFDAQTGELLSLLVWFLFGAVMVTALDATTWQTVAFTALALTGARMLPVAIALAGTHLSRTTVAFIGWFGPRGLASIVFGIIAFDSLNGSEGEVVLATIALTVLASVVLHGATARPFSLRYSGHARELDDTRPEQAAVAHLESRPIGGLRPPRPSIDPSGPLP